jgi:hypothetical protein
LAGGFRASSDWQTVHCRPSIVRTRYTIKVRQRVSDAGSKVGGLPRYKCIQVAVEWLSVEDLEVRIIPQ